MFPPLRHLQFDKRVEGEPARPKDPRKHVRLPNDVAPDAERTRQSGILTRVLRGAGEGEGAAPASARPGSGVARMDGGAPPAPRAMKAGGGRGGRGGRGGGGGRGRGGGGGGRGGGGRGGGGGGGGRGGRGGFSGDRKGFKGK